MFLARRIAIWTFYLFTLLNLGEILEWELDSLIAVVLVIIGATLFSLDWEEQRKH